MNRVGRVLISVSDKTGLVPFARGVARIGAEIVSTGGTARLLREQGIRVREIADFTGFPEILDGRVKTLHPKVHGAILADRSNRRHLQQAKELKIGLIDLVVVNLYPFESVVSRKITPLNKLIEEIDIGGVTLLRASAKNYRSVGIVSSPCQYEAVLKELQGNRGVLSDATRALLAVKAFEQTAAYDAVIGQALAQKLLKDSRRTPRRLTLSAVKKQTLRYGENPHQAGVWYEAPALFGNSRGLASARQLNGKELSFNNLLDLDAAVDMASAFPKPTAVVIKHNNPCGLASAANLAAAYQKAFAGDPLSAFGGIVGLNRRVDRAAARAISNSGFLECIIAPGYDPAALKILSEKKNLRIMELPSIGSSRNKNRIQIKQIQGGFLVQDADALHKRPAQWKCVTPKKPTLAQKRDLIFAWTVTPFVRSNSIVIVKDEQVVGVGAGMTSRVDSVEFAVKKAGKRAKGAVLASDGFFPKPDGPLAAVKAGIRAIIQPGGSIQDEEVIRVARKAGVAMVLTGERHFKH